MYWHIKSIGAGTVFKSWRLASSSVSFYCPKGLGSQPRLGLMQMGSDPHERWHSENIGPTPVTAASDRCLLTVLQHGVQAACLFGKTLHGQAIPHGTEYRKFLTRPSSNFNTWHTPCCWVSMPLPPALPLLRRDASTWGGSYSHLRPLETNAHSLCRTMLQKQKRQIAHRKDICDSKVQWTSPIAE